MNFIHEGLQKTQQMENDANISGHDENSFNLCPYEVLELICHLLPFKLMNKKQLILLKQVDLMGVGS